MDSSKAEKRWGVQIQCRTVSLALFFFFPDGPFTMLPSLHLPTQMFPVKELALCSSFQNGMVPESLKKGICVFTRWLALDINSCWKELPKPFYKYPWNQWLKIDFISFCPPDGSLIFLEWCYNFGSWQQWVTAWASPFLQPDSKHLGISPNLRPRCLEILPSTSSNLKKNCNYIH